MYKNHAIKFTLLNTFVAIRTAAVCPQRRRSNWTVLQAVLTHFSVRAKNLCLPAQCWRAAHALIQAVLVALHPATNLVVSTLKLAAGFNALLFFLFQRLGPALVKLYAQNNYTQHNP